MSAAFDSPSDTGMAEGMKSTCPSSAASTAGFQTRCRKLDGRISAPFLVRNNDSSFDRSVIRGARRLDNTSGIAMVLLPDAVLGGRNAANLAISSRSTDLAISSRSTVSPAARGERTSCLYGPTSRY